MQLIEVLRDSGTITQEAYDLLRNHRQQEAAATKQMVKEEVKMAAEEAGKEAAKSAGLPKIHTKGKLAVESNDGAFEFRVGGRMMFDSVWYDGDLEDEGAEDSVEFRRARMYLSGKLWEVWKYKAQFDFAGAAKDDSGTFDAVTGVDFAAGTTTMGTYSDGNTADDVEIKELHLKYTGFKLGTVTLGNTKFPFSIEELTSSKYDTFMEQSLPVNAFAHGRRIGLRFDGHWEHIGAAAGVFSADDINNLHDDGFLVSGRVYYSPWHEKTRALHLGAAVLYEEHGGDTFRYRTRPETHSEIGRLVSTGRMPADSAVQWGLEGAWVQGPWHLQGEVIGAEVDGSGDPSPWGAYVEGSYFLTGESRPYDFKAGTWKVVKPARPMGSEGFGAWQLALRFSHVDLDDGLVTDRAGDEQNVTLGVNWYPNANLRFSANYVNVLDIDYEDPARSDVDGDAVQVRAQWHF
jgi:phosphate-selective porin OprO/OprP